MCLYKKLPIIVKEVSDKLTILYATGKTKKVREHELELIHDGPLYDFSIEVCIGSNLTEALDYSREEAISLEDLSDLLYDDFTAKQALSTYMLLNEGLYFFGTIHQIQGKSQKDIDEKLQAKKEKEEANTKWKDFISRIKSGSIIEDDAPYIKELERLAWGKIQESKILHELKIEQLPENAHRLLIKINYWEFQNPYLQRYELPEPPQLTDSYKLPDEERVDLTHLNSYAIDDVGNQDPDDAIALEGNTLWVHIADVSAIIKSDTPLDLECIARGSSAYLPEKTIPLLPKVFTEIFGMGIQEKSPAFSFAITLNDEGQVIDFKPCISWVNVKRLSYNEVDEKISESPFTELYNITQLSEQRRLKNNASNLDLPEVNIRVKDNGNQISIEPIKSSKSRQMVAEAMILAGEAIAAYCEKEDIPIPYAVQEAPDELQSPTDLAGMFAYRRKFKRSVIKVQAGAHFGLGIKQYTRATSPLRRVQDLIVHQQLRAHLKNEERMTTKELKLKIHQLDLSLPPIIKASRFSNKHWTLVYVKQNIDKEWTAIHVVKEEKYSLFMIPELALEFKHKPKDKSLALNESITLKAISIDLPDLSIQFKEI